MGEWTDLAVAFVLVGGFCIGVCWLSFLQGVKVGKAVHPCIPASPTRPMRMGTGEGNLGKGTSTAVAMRCSRCGQVNSHHPNCPNAQPKEKRIGKPWVGFSRAKRELESQESINATE